MTGPPGQVAGFFLRALIDAAQRFGVHEDEVLDACDVGRESVNYDDWIPVELIARAWDVVPLLCDEPNFGVRACIDHPVGLLGTIDLAIANAENGAQAMETGVRFYNLVGGLFALSHEVDDHDTHIRASCAAPATAHARRHALEHLFAIISVRYRQHLGADVRARVGFAHAAPRDVSSHVRVFGRRVTFDAGTNTWSAPNHVLQKPIRTSNPRVFELLKGVSFAEGKVRPIPIVQYVRSLLPYVLSSPQSPLEVVASGLRVDVRTVQRYLQHAGTSFKEQLEDARLRVARRLLTHAQLRLNDIAKVLGFGDARTFSKAFQRWTGLSPNEFRAQLAPSREDTSPYG